MTRVKMRNMKTKTKQPKTKTTLAKKTIKTTQGLSIGPHTQDPSPSANNPSQGGSIPSTDTMAYKSRIPSLPP
jgi:hypothetical protein